MQETEVKDESETSEENSKVYELGYLLASTIKEEDVSVNYGNLKELVSSFNGEIISDEMPKMTNLAYSMVKVTSNMRNKFNTAYFGWIKFVMDSQKVLEKKKHLDLDPNIIRFLILKTVKENTIATKSTKNEIATPINKEEIDKEIDALVAV